jgi:cell division protein FtsL
MSLLDRPLHAPAGWSTLGARRWLALTLTLALVSAAVLLPVVQSSDETAQGYRIRALEQQKADLEAQIYQTQAQLAQLGALSRIDVEARTRLGMVPVQREIAITVPVPLPRSDALPSSFRPATQAPKPDATPTIWQRLRHLLPLP